MPTPLMTFSLKETRFVRPGEPDLELASAAACFSTPTGSPPQGIERLAEDGACAVYRVLTQGNLAGTPLAPFETDAGDLSVEGASTGPLSFAPADGNASCHFGNLAQDAKDVFSSGDALVFRGS